MNGSFVLGFDGDGPDVFARTVAWIEQCRLEGATFHILTPYPGTPLFRTYEEEGRILHRDWDLYDTAHCVFRPRLMTPRDLEEGYAWCYRRVFGLRSIWSRRARPAADVPGYLAVSLLYKKMNFLWPFLIRWRLTHAAWRPLVEAARRRNLAWRRRLGVDRRLTRHLVRDDGNRARYRPPAQGSPTGYNGHSGRRATAGARPS